MKGIAAVAAHDSEQKESFVGCRSCGESPGSTRRRYCSARCLRDLKRQLDFVQILLQVVRTRYAAFWWTTTEVALQVVPYRSDECLCFVHPRSNLRKPSQALRKLTETLGQFWQHALKVSRSRLRASRAVLEQASETTKASTLSSLVKRQVVLRAVTARQLAILCLRPEDLRGSQRQERLRKAYRAQAMVKHPDRGGSAQAFMAVRMAFEAISKQAPFDSQEQYGLPNAWLYDGNRRTWRAPLV